MRGLASMMEGDHFTSMYSFEFGTRKRDYGYHPRTKTDVEQWYRTALDLCAKIEQIPHLRDAARDRFGKEMRGLSQYSTFADAVLGLARKFEGDGGWPEGWAAARGAVKSLERSKQTELIASYGLLAKELQPAGLSSRIASYVLPERWSPLDIADVDFDDDRKYAKAEAEVDAVCVGIGKELATNPPAFSAHLKKLLTSKSSRVWTVFSSIARESADWRETWQQVVDAYADLASEERQDGALVGFAAGLAEKDGEARETLLDDAFSTPTVHRALVRMHMSPRINGRGAERLSAAARIETVPTWTFANLQMGRSCDDLTGAQLAPLISAVCEREDGPAVAVEIMSMRAYSRRDDQKRLDADDREIGRRLLLDFPWGRTNSNAAESVAQIAKACLVAPGDEAVARQICERLLGGFGTYAIYSGDYGKLIGALAREFPQVVLDELVEKELPSREHRRGIFQNFRESRPCPLDKIADQTLIDWARAGSEERFAYLADSIRAWNNADGTNNDEEAGELIWTSAALRLISEAPDPEPVLRTFFARFNPSGWSGSLAEILRSRLPLLDQLEANARPEVADWARRVRTPHQQNIEKAREWESRESRDRDEKFEW